MKNILRMLNALEKCHTDTLQEKIIKNDGVSAMFQTLDKIGLKDKIKYTSGKGYTEIKNK